MARPIVVDPTDGARVPFLRGILTHSLQDSGLEFEDAYRVAAAVREELDATGEITTESLRSRVVQHLQAIGDEAADRYANPRQAPTIHLRFASGQVVPFSRGRHRLCLETCGLDPEDANDITSALHEQLLRDRTFEITGRELKRMTYSLLSSKLGTDAARNYAVWEQFRQSGRPLIVVIGGATGSGKTSLASELAHMLDFMRVQSTDMLREVMRVMVPQRLLPVLHANSFRAWEVLPAEDPPPGEPDAHLIDGYLSQVDLLGVACEAAVQRALAESTSLILEGVHVHPNLLQRISSGADAIVVPVMLGLLKPSQLKQRLRGRGKEAPGRIAREHLENFDAIWRLQSYLLSEADRAGIPIVVNESRDKTVSGVIDHIVEVLGESFQGDPAETFG